MSMIIKLYMIDYKDDDIDLFISISTTYSIIYFSHDQLFPVHTICAILSRYRIENRFFEPRVIQKYFDIIHILIL